MPNQKSEIIAQLQREINSLQGFKPAPANSGIDIELGPIAEAFPNHSFTLGAVHELISKPETAAATCGFIAGILASLMRYGGASVWISSCRTVFPIGLKQFGIKPDRIIFVDTKKEREVLWAMEEALKCGGLAGVVGEIQEIGFTASRRLQLAVEQSRVTGFIVRHRPRSLNTTASVSRWKISPIPSELEEGMPGVGFPRWNVELLRVRNGRPGNWQIEWNAGHFKSIQQNVQPVAAIQQKKAG